MEAAGVRKLEAWATAVSLVRAVATAQAVAELVMASGDVGGIDGGDSSVGNSSDDENRDVRRIDRGVGAIVLHQNGRWTRGGRQRQPG